VLNATNNELVFTDGFLSASDDVVQIKVYDWAEQTGLGAAELVKLYSLFYNVEAVATSLFETISNQYNCVSEKVKKVTELSSKKILWCSYAGEFSDDNSDGWSCGTCPNYYCDYASTLGSEILDYNHYGFTGFNGGGPYNCTYLLTNIEFLQMSMDADIFIYTGDDFSKVYGMKKQLLDQMPALQKYMVFGTFGRGISPGNDWFESRLIQPDVVLEDFLSAIATGSIYHVNHDPVWIQNVWESHNEFKDPNAFKRGPCIDINSSLELSTGICDNLFLVDYHHSSGNDDGLSSKQITAIIISSLVVLILLFIAIAVSVHTLRRMREEKIPFMRVSSVELNHHYV